MDGNWLTEAAGNKIPVTSGKGEKGDTGSAGQDGTDGADGKTPQLKIEDGYWYLSYDGTNWTKLGKATGENGTAGEKGDKGDSMFSAVTQDDKYVYFTLTDGTIIKIAKGSGSPDSTHADSEIIEFKDLNAKMALLFHRPAIDTDGDGEISFGEARTVKRLYFQDTSINEVLSFLELRYFENLTYYGRASSVLSDDIGYSYQAKLFEISLPNGLDTIGSNAFSNSQLRNLTIPTGCKVIEREAFNECKNITVSFPEQSQCEYIGSLANVRIQGYLLPNTIKYLGSNAVNYGGKTAYILENLEGAIQSFNYDTIMWNAIKFPRSVYRI